MRGTSNICTGHKGWRKLYERHYAFALRLAFRYLGDYEEARTAVYDTWHRLFNSRGRRIAGVGAAVFREHLQRELVEVVVAPMRQREPAGRRGMAEADGSGGSAATTAAGADIWDMPFGGRERAEAEGYRSLILQLIGLPPSLRLIFNLRVIDGYSSAEAAILLGIETTAVESQLSCARSILRGKINNII